MSNKMVALKHSVEDQIAAERQILSLQKVTDYRMKE
jgi:DICT domain-containing protein